MDIELEMEMDLHLIRVDVGEVIEPHLDIVESSGEGDGDGEGAAAGLYHHQADTPLALHHTVAGLE